MSKPYFHKFFTLIAIVAGFTFSAELIRGQETPGTERFRVGEKLTYTISIGNAQNAAFAETLVSSDGTLGGVPAVDLQFRFKTLNFASAAFFLVDEEYTTFAAKDSGLPLYIKRVERSSGLAKERVTDINEILPSSYDLTTLIYAIRRNLAGGSLTLQEDGRTYAISFQNSGADSVKTGAGEFATNTIVVQSEYFTAKGLKDVSIDLTTDEFRIPVRFRAVTSKGPLVALLSGIQMIGLPPTPITQPEATPTPLPVATPTPIATPPPYIENESLNPDLAFDLGEALTYRVSSGGQNIGTVLVRAESRKLFERIDSLLLSMTVTEVVPMQQLFRMNDSIRAWVDPVTLSPRRLEIATTGALGGLAQTVIFDRDTSFITYGGANRLEAPVGTHSILSLLYAMRSFNLKPSGAGGSPVNDTRVAVFWNDRTSIFSLRPSSAELITQQGEKNAAQLITLVTQIPQIDLLAPKVWLANTDRRTPLRISLGAYTLDLTAETVIPPK